MKKPGIDIYALGEFYLAWPGAIKRVALKRTAFVKVVLFALKTALEMQFLWIKVKGRSLTQLIAYSALSAKKIVRRKQLRIVLEVNLIGIFNDIADDKVCFSQTGMIKRHKYTLWRFQF